MYFLCYDYIFSLYVYVWLPWLRFFRAFSSVVRQMPGLNPQRRGTTHTIPNFCVVLCIFLLFYVFLCCSMYCSSVVLCIVYVCICVLNYCHRVATQLQLNISYHISYRIISYIISYYIISYIIYHIASYIVSYIISRPHLITEHARDTYEDSNKINIVCASPV